jgi:hypothetical protein
MRLDSLLHRLPLTAMTALPHYPPQLLLGENKLWLDAYEQCLNFQNRVAYPTCLPVVTQSSPEFDLLTCARFLGYMLLEAPTVEGRNNLSGEVLECTTDEQRLKLAESYLRCFLLCCKKRMPIGPLSHS